jgi:hypothetical protein
MKKLLLALGLLSASLSYAQGIPISQVRMTMQCFPLSEFTRVLESYAEEPMFTMDTLIVQNDKEVVTASVFTLNVETREWTLYRQVNDETVCFQAAGENFDFIGKSTKSKKDML